jgi:hypothetical protein
MIGVTWESWMSGESGEGAAVGHHGQAGLSAESVAMSTIGFGAQAFVSAHSGGRDTNQYRVGQVPDNGK